MDADYIIVGSGSAGSVLANRLSESGKHRVVVLEAGGTDRRFYVHLPLGYGKLFYDPKVNWMYSTQPDPGLAGSADHWPRGKILGGSSSINAMVYIRGNRADYDEWGQAAPGWGWDQVLPAFRAMEDNEAGSDDYRGAGGLCSFLKTAVVCTGWWKITSRRRAKRVCPIPPISTGKPKKALVTTR